MKEFFLKTKLFLELKKNLNKKNFFWNLWKLEEVFFQGINVF